MVYTSVTFPVDTPMWIPPGTPRTPGKPLAPVRPGPPVIQYNTLQIPNSNTDTQFQGKHRGWRTYKQTCGKRSFEMLGLRKTSSTVFSTLTLISFSLAQSMTWAISSSTDVLECWGHKCEASWAYTWGDNLVYLEVWGHGWTLWRVLVQCQNLAGLVSPNGCQKERLSIGEVEYITGQVLLPVS